MAPAFFEQLTNRQVRPKTILRSIHSHATRRRKPLLPASGGTLELQRVVDDRLNEAVGVYTAPHCFSANALGELGIERDGHPDRTFLVYPTLRSNRPATTISAPPRTFSAAKEP